MIHTGLAGLCGVSLGEFFTDAKAMARVMIDGGRWFGFDGVQLSLGVAAEPEALGASTEQPPDGAPILREHLLADPSYLDRLAEIDVVNRGRMPLFREAVERTAEAVGDEMFVLATGRGPLLAASQLRGPEKLLVDMLEDPGLVDRILEFTTEMTARIARSWLPCSAHGLLLGEATCSPSFISPDLYRNLVMPHHQRLVGEFEAMGWQAVGLHVCGRTSAILRDLVSTGVDFLDVDYQVPAGEAIELAGNQVALRGNLDPGAVLRFGTPDTVRKATSALCEAAAGARWIVSSGCDIPPGTPAENIAAFVNIARGKNA